MDKHIEKHGFIILKDFFYSIVVVNSYCTKYNSNTCNNIKLFINTHNKNKIASPASI